MLLLAGPACSSSLRRTLPPEDQARFRSAAMQTLKEAAFSNEPILRMHAIEAFQEVAPDDGVSSIEANLENGYAGVSFAALMALGAIRNADFVERIRIRAEDPDPNVVIAALYALHRLGDQSRTGELSEFLLNHRDARVRANAALVIGRLDEPKSVKLLHLALHKEKKTAVKLQILEALATLGDRNAIERLIFDGYSAVPDQAARALMFLANARCMEAEDLFLYRLHSSEYPDIRLQAARGLGKLGRDDGLDLALAHLAFRSPARGRVDDPPEQQVARVRGLAALALEAIGNPQALRSLWDAFLADRQTAYVRLTIARAAIRIIDLHCRPPAATPPEPARAALETQGPPRMPAASPRTSGMPDQPADLSMKAQVLP
jgi:HEAT repeat protein